MKKKTHFGLLCLAFLLATHSLFSQGTSPESWRNISGEKYDWTKTMRPEQPYMHAYHQMQLMKIMLSYPDEKGNPVICYTFEQVLSLVKQMDAVTRGLPKTLYLGSVRLSLEPDEAVSVFPSTGCHKSGF